MREIVIAGGEAGQRLDKFLRKYLREASPSFIYRMLRKKNITRNGRKAEGSDLTAEGDRIRFYFSEETFLKFRGTSISENAAAPKLPDACVLYADTDFLVLNKPAGYLTQPDGGDVPALSDGLTDLLLGRGLVKEEDLRAFRPAPVNRLDRNTSGIVLAGVSLGGSQILSALIKERSLKKEYLVLVEGDADLRGVKKAHYQKDRKNNLVSIRPVMADDPPASVIVTSFAAIGRTEEASLLKAELITGRSHQIRAHLKYLGHPVIGDRKYGAGPSHGAGRQMLHAFRVTFPEDARLKGSGLYGRAITAPPPEDMRRVMASYGLDGMFADV